MAAQIAEEMGDDDDAARLYRSAAAQGHAKAKVNLGIMMYGGVGCPEDKPAAVALWRIVQENPSSHATIASAGSAGDLIALLKDGANDDVLNSGRVGSIAELKPGENAFRLKLVVGASQPLPLKLKAFKAQGVTQKLNASPNPYDDYTEFDDFGAQK